MRTSAFGGGNQGGGPTGPLRRPHRGAGRARAAATAGLVGVLAAGLLAACGSTTSPPSSSGGGRASVHITGSAATLADAGGAVVVHRDPFSLSVEDAAGRTVLHDAVQPAGAPVVVPPTTDPEPPGQPNRAASPDYGPLSFLVGSQTVSQYPSGFFAGDLQSATFQGTAYAATRVLSVARHGVDLVAHVATNDPSGRQLVVTASPSIAGQGLALSVEASPSAGVVMIGDSFASPAGEGFFGFGGVHDGLDQRGQLIDSWAEQENINGLTGPGAGGNGQSLYPNGATAAYYVQPEFVSSAGYGFLVADTTLTRFRLDADRPDAWNIRTSGSRLDVVVAPGTATHDIATLTSLSGRQPAPPQWALGPQMDRLLAHSSNAKADYASELASDLADIARYHLPLTAYRIEGWGDPSGDNALNLPSATPPAVLTSTIASLQRLGIHPLVYLRPWVDPSSTAVADHLVATDASGAPATIAGTSGSDIALLDFTNPAAVRFWDAQVDHALSLGADGFMLDFGEQVLTSMHFADGQTGATMHNEYQVLVDKATRAAITAYEKDHPGRTVWFYTRSGFSGTPGSAAYEGGNFPGDEETSWTHSSGIASLASDMLNRALFGAYGYGTDIGGYADIFTPPTTAELFDRWAEWAALSPVFRLHGSAIAGTHTPWSYGTATLDLYIQLSKLHLRAAPYIESLWRQADRTGIPPTRPLWLADPTSTAARQADQQWMLGTDVLVAPVVTQGATSRSLYVPPGCWAPQGGTGGGTLQGPGTVTVTAPLTVLPYWFRCGTHPF